MLFTKDRMYLPLHQQEELLSDAEITNPAAEQLSGSTGKTSTSKARHRQCPNLWTSLVIAMLLIIVALQHVNLQNLRKFGTGISETGLSLPRDARRIAHAPNGFLAENETEADMAWDAIKAGHGAVFLDSTWSVEHGIPETMRHPSETDKAVYWIAAYHDIHCIQYLRQHYKALLQGEKATWSLEHDMHCFDSLRQQTMCHADDTLLYSTGHRDTGHGQLRRCKNWDTLRDWATERTACYHDHDFPSNETRWGRCDGGDDGLPRGSLLS